MPFTSKSQQRYMYARHPKLAKEFAASTPDIKSLPEKVANPKNKGSKKRRYSRINGTRKR